MQTAAICTWPVCTRHRYVTTSEKGRSGENQKGRSVLAKTLLAMKLTAILLTAAFLQVQATGVSQTVTYKGENVSLDKVFEEVKRQTGYVFFYDEAILQQAKPVTVQANDVPLEEFLDDILSDQLLKYTIESKNIIISKKPMPPHLSKGIDKKAPPVTGIVRGPDGQPLSGVNVMVKGTKRGTTTDKDGRFSIEAEEGSVLEISSIGFGRKLVPVSSSKELVVALDIASSVLDEVQYIAYGQTTKRLQTGNVATIKGADIEKQPVNNPLLALQGRAPGLFITQSNGLPGGGVTVRVQGVNSIQSGNDPLYVIDGLPYYSQLQATGIDLILGESGQPAGSPVHFKGSPLHYVNTLDIESMEILKDADATAIYGSRAANGAILITTKKGKAGAAKISFNLQTGWGKVASKIEMLNTSQYLQMRKEAFINDGVSIPLYDPNATADFDLTFWDSTRNTDWQKVLIGNTSRYHSYSANVSGGSPTFQYLIGATYHRESSVFLLPDDYADQKTAVHFNLNNISTNQKLRLQFSGNYMVDNNQLPNTDITPIAVRMEPNAPALYTDDGSINWEPNASGSSTFFNPASMYTKYVNNTNNLISSLKVQYELIKGLSIRCNFGYNKMQTKDFSPGPTGIYPPEFIPFIDRTAVYGDRSISNWNIEPQLSYEKEIGIGKIEALTGATIQEINTNGGYLFGYGYATDLVLEDPKAATNISVENSFVTQYKYNAIFGRLNYNVKNKYILNFTARRDGSSRFGVANRFHNFGAVGAAWLFHQEKIFANSPVLSFGKIRASFGTTGNDQIPEYRFLNLYDRVSNVEVPYQGGTSLQPSGLPNPHLQWEETKKLQFGVDLGFFNDRILLGVGYVQNRSSNQLLRYVLPGITGFSNIIANFPATVENVSWEYSLSTTTYKTRKITWTSNLNLTVPKNKLVSFPNIESSSYRGSLVIGQPINITKVYRFVGVDPVTGNYQVDDTHGNPTTSYPSDDANIIINTLPKFYGGIENSIMFKSLQLDFLFQFVKQIGINTLFYNGSLSPGQFQRRNSNQPTTVLDRWQKTGDEAAIQRFSTASDNLALASEYLYSDASYTRLKNLSLSWQIPTNWSKNIKMESCKVYIQGQNLITITNYKGLDPETQTIESLPPLKVLTIGLRVVL
jgi:TonB-dependent starch-binding outer membrane protein SusC